MTLERAFAICIFSLSLFGIDAHALPGDADQPIHLFMDNAEGDMTGQTILTGSVSMDQGTLRVEAERMIIDREDDKVLRVTAEGTERNRAYYHQQLKPDAELVKAKALKIIYHIANERIELIGSAYLTQEQNEFRGEMINYDIRRGKVVATSHEKRRVEMILHPTKNNQ
jgi:lipopolysaccharide export system protein LptA